jgi:hypothetical protein
MAWYRDSFTFFYLLPAHGGSSLADFSTLKMEAIRSCETSVQSTTSTRRHTPEGGILHVVVSHKLWFLGMCGWAHCHDEGASCGCTKVPVFFIAHFLSRISKHHSKSQS